MRAESLRLPEPVERGLVVTRRLGTGRLLVPAELEHLCGLSAGVEVVVATAGAQLLVHRACGAAEVNGRRHRIDRFGRLQLRQGQRRVLGVADDALVLLMAEGDSGLLRIVEPTRILGLLVPTTPEKDEREDRKDEHGPGPSLGMVPAREEPA